MKFVLLFFCILSALLISHLTCGYPLDKYHNFKDKSLHIVPEGRPIMKHITYWYDTESSKGEYNPLEDGAGDADGGADDDDDEPADDEDGGADDGDGDPYYYYEDGDDGPDATDGYDIGGDGDHDGSY